MADGSTIKNQLIQKLPEYLATTLLDAAEFIHLDSRENIIEPNKPIAYVDFPESGVTSVVKPMDDNTVIEIATIGKEGMVGLPVAMGVSAIENLVFCQVEGTSWRLPAKTFVKLFNEHEELRMTCLRYSVIFADQVSHNMGCNRTHSIEERCARWLLMTHDRCESDMFGLTQEFLAAMRGVSRTGVNLAAGILAKAQLISYARGKITILDRPGLENVCCHCYFSMREYAARVMA